uniref:Uncharacterized protein n=1 Tax=Cucumis sativus TaxID=3659 RepID=A0A0A0LXV8_CUCSA
MMVLTLIGATIIPFRGRWCSVKPFQSIDDNNSSESGEKAPSWLIEAIKSFFDQENSKKKGVGSEADAKALTLADTVLNIDNGCRASSKSRIESDKKTN